MKYEDIHTHNLSTERLNRKDHPGNQECPSVTSGQALCHILPLRARQLHITLSGVRAESNCLCLLFAVLLLCIFRYYALCGIKVLDQEGGGAGRGREGGRQT